MFAKKNHWILLWSVQILATMVSSEIETFKMPAGEQKIEVIRGDTKRVYFGVKNVTTEDISNYDLRLGYKTANIQPGSTNGLDHLLTLDIGTCISVAVGTKCKEMEVSLNGDPDLHGENISLVVYVYTLHPVLQVILPLEETESFTLQEFNIQIVEPPAVTCPPAVAAAPDTIKWWECSAGCATNYCLSSLFWRQRCHTGNVVLGEKE
ncbi:uncharacterized protein LOC135345704 isoform X5 [Halichondria panicea]|uniref:uncharacterized protein LOC135345704 isoform X5 n=1 Tax=Halichondria panicea TaxID=6063 RepID=UPI00312BC033